METIDILLATYNGEKYLKEQLDSILNQTYTNFRLIISDDNSKDKTINILKEYEEKDKRIKVYTRNENLGAIKNFEFLLEKVQSNYYMLSDQDDVWYKNKIEECYNHIKKEDADLVFTDLEVVDKKLNTINKSFNNQMNLTRKIQKTKEYEMLYLYNCVTGCTIIANKRMLNQILPFPKNNKYILHDHWIGLITSLKGKISYINKPYIKYRQHEDNVVGIEKTSYKMKSLDEIRKLFIDIKLNLFKTYTQNNEKFPKNIQKLNNKSLMYFEMVKDKKNINFKGWTTFYKLYKNETLSYFILNFVIINLPVIGRVLFRLKKRN